MPLKGDEIGFVETGRILFRTFFIERDFFSDVWLKSYNNYGVHNPRVGLFILGGMDILASTFFSSDKTIILRFLNAIFSALGVLFVFIFTEKLWSRKAACVALALLLLNPIFSTVAISLTPDIHMFFFVAVSLVLLVSFDNRTVFSKRHLLLSVCIGLAISCRLYAFCIYLTFCLMLFKKGNNVSCSRSLSLFYTTFIAGCVFFISNPVLYSNFFTGIELMTIGHVESLTADPIIGQFSRIRYLFVYPYILLRYMPFDVCTEIAGTTITTLNYLSVFIVYWFVFKGIKVCCYFRRYLPVLFFLSAHVFIAYPLIVLGPDRLNPKIFLLSGLSVICLVAGSFSKTQKF